jgi:hypothetical protein
MNYNKEFNNLGYILGYFHQSWSSLYEWQKKEPEFEAVVRYAKLENDLSKIELAKKECVAFLQLSLTTIELENAVDEFTGSGFSPFSTHREFFERILDVLKEPMEETKKHFIPKFIG